MKTIRFCSYILFLLFILVSYLLIGEMISQDYHNTIANSGQNISLIPKYWDKSKDINHTAVNNEIDSIGWYSTVADNIKKSEYNITLHEESGIYLSPNRAQNLRFIYSTDGFTVKPRLTRIPLFDQSDITLKEEDKIYREIEDWQVKMKLIGYGKEEQMKDFGGKELSVNANTAFIEDEDLKIEYINDETGMRQNFIVKQKPNGNGLVKVKVSAETELKMQVGADAVVFNNSSFEEKIKYTSLKVWDAENRSLEAQFEKEEENLFAIVVNDADAVYPVTIDPVSLTRNWSAESNQESGWFGWRVSTAGDVNGDGYSDVIIGAIGYDNGQNGEGRAYVYHGSSSGLSVTANWITESNQENAEYGWSVYTAGDVNGDGYSDVIVGSHFYDNGQSNEGMVYVYHGSSSGLSTTPNWTMESNQTDAEFGYSVATAGDINNDGFSDIIIGAPYFDNGETDEGRVFVYYGSSGGLSTTANRILESNQGSAYFGICVSSAGDVNNDGFSDVIIGASNYDNGQNDEGKAFLYYGSASGLSETVNWTAESDQEAAEFGISVSTAGDVNGDGYSDIIIGAHFYDNVEWDEGRAFVYHGSSSGPSAVANWTAENDQAGSAFGKSVSTAGDFNGDGYSDVIVGAHQYPYGWWNGKVYLYLGTGSGLNNTYYGTDESNQGYCNFGYSVSTAGDVNGDGFSDAIVGALNYDNGQTNEGSAFVYYGSGSGQNNYLTVTPQNRFVSNVAGSTTFSVASNINWTVSDNADWLTVSPANGTNNGTLTASYTENTTTSQRVGTITVTGGGITRTVTVTQAAGNYLTVSPSNQSVVKAAGSTTFSVSSSISWTVSDDADWITVSPNNGTNNGTLTATYTENTTTNQRVGTITVSGGGITRAVTLTQEGTTGTTCPPTMISYWKLDETTGSEFDDYVGTNNATSTNVPTSVAGKVGNARQFNGTSNNMSAARITAYDFAANSSFSFEAWINHAASTSSAEQIVMERKPTSGSLVINLKTTATTVTFLARNIGGQLYSAAATKSLYDGIWHHLVGVKDGSLNQLRLYVDGVLQKTVTATYTSGFTSTTAGISIGWRNTSDPSYFKGAIDEVAIHSVGLDSATITQHYNNGLLNKGYCDQASNDYLTVTPPNRDVSYLAGSTTFSVASNLSWSVSDNADWLTVSPVNGTNNGTLTATYTENTITSQRVGTITVTGGAITRTVTVTQAANPNILTVTPADRSVSYGAGSTTFFVTSNISWTVSDDADWLTVSPDNGTNNGTLTATYTENTTTSQRVGTITVTGGGITRTVTVTQQDRTGANWTAEPNQAEAWYAVCVSTAGDVNGDGFGDVIVGAYGYDDPDYNEGGAFVYHGSSSGLSLTPNWIGTGNQFNAMYGLSVSTAGDVNGDGYSDIIVGAHAFDNGQANEGMAFVYYGSASGLSTIANWTTEGNQLTALYAGSVCTAGDVNGDGFSDVIVGSSPYDNGETNEGRAFLYHGSAGGLSTVPNWTAESNQAMAEFGVRVATAGDINGDGYSDVIVGAHKFDNGETDEGKAYVYYGSAAGLSSTPNWTAEGNSPGAYFGYSVYTAGDVNGDGYSDVVVGAWGYNSSTGFVNVYYGSSSGLSTSPNWTSYSDQLGALYGVDVSTAGDFNDDGYDDLLIGAKDYDNGQTNEGRAYIYLGSSSGLSSSPYWTAESDQESAELGHTAKTAGDVNGDGYGDVIIGSYVYDNGENNEGRAFVYHGSGSGQNNITVTPSNRDVSNVSGSTTFSVTSNVSWTVSDNAGWLTVSPVNGTNNGTLTATYTENTTTSQRVGTITVTGGAITRTLTVTQAAGPEILTVTPSDRSVSYTAGSTDYSVTSNISWTVSDNADWVTVSPVNGTNNGTLTATYTANTTTSQRVGTITVTGGGITRTVTVTQATNFNPISLTRNWSAESNQESGWFGWRVSTAGDVNGDGYSDVIIGAIGYDNGQNGEGRAYVYHGSSSGLSVTANWITESNQDNAEYGWSVASAGDVNGDGYSDVIVGSHFYDNGESNEGMVYVYHGSSSGLSTTPNWTMEGNQADTEFGFSVATAGDVNDDGFSDIIVGAPYYDNGETDEGRAFIYYGSSSGLSTTANLILESNQGSAYFGISVSCAGDVNGDGFSDVIIGASNYDNGQNDEGRAYVYHGSSSGLSVTANWITENNQDGSWYGRCVSSAGDVNGDGYGDVVIGAPMFPSFENGTAYLYEGSASGLSNTPNWTAQNDPVGSMFGWSASTAGDFNGDGYSDVIVGAHQYTWGSWNGKVYLYLGSGSGLNNTFYGTDESNQGYCNFGYSVSTAGDVNGDGFSDIIVGALNYDNGELNEGSAFVYYGVSDDNYLTVTPLYQSVSYAAGSTTFSVTSNVSWTVSDDADWITVNPVNGTNDGTLTTTYTENTIASQRVGTITVTGGGITRTVTVTQAASNYLTVSPSNQTVYGSAGSTTFSVSSNVSWTVSDDADWITVSPDNGTNNGTLTATYTENTNTSQRVGTITVTGEGITRTVTVTQISKYLFTEQTGIVLTGVHTSSVSWGDYDNDGDLDILLVGASGSGGVSKIYRNNNNNTFTEQTSISLFGLFWASAAWGDYDNDGDLDIIMAGATGDGGATKIYRNNGDNTFSEQTSISLIGLFWSSVAWGDYDNDGDLDILLTGASDIWNAISLIYKNNGNNTFSEQPISLWGVAGSSSAWGDYDNDGDLDILLTGNVYSMGVQFFGIYRNDNNNTFTRQLIDIGVSDGSATWGDYDNDGDLDILRCGGNNSHGPISTIYRNNGNSTFTGILSLTGVWGCSAAWGDYDNDGDLDILLTGNTGDTGSELPISKIYRNDGNDDFAEQTFSLTGVGYSSAAWGDYDNDGDLDIILTGLAGTITTGDIVSKIYRNDNIAANNIPSIPTNLLASLNGNDATFRWNKSTDTETPQNGLRYNLVIGTSPNAVNTLSPMSNRNNGYRRVINLGNTNHNNSWTIKDLSPGTYYWSVQAIDNCFAGSNFAPEKSFLFSIYLTVLIEGFWNGTSMVSDVVTVQLRSSTSPYSLVEEDEVTLNTTGGGTAVFSTISALTPYYIVIKHRNSIETWSALPQQFTYGTLSYDFTTTATQAYGDNMSLKGGKWAIFSGDVNQDGVIDALDRSACWNDRNLAGYLTTDLNGDNVVDALDRSICWNNGNEIRRRPDEGGTCPTTVLYEGKTYNTVLIGTQCWLRENLDVGTRINGNQNQSNNSIIEKYCYANDPSNCGTYGGLYQWKEAMQYVTTQSAQGICPPGWHIPTYAQLQTLRDDVGGNGNALKAIGQGSGSGAGTNTSGFSALLAGWGDDGQNFIDLGHWAYFWSSTEIPPGLAYDMGLHYNQGVIRFYNVYKDYSFSVRCIKD